MAIPTKRKTYYIHSQVVKYIQSEIRWMSQFSTGIIMRRVYESRRFLYPSYFTFYTSCGIQEM